MIERGAARLVPQDGLEDGQDYDSGPAEHQEEGRDALANLRLEGVGSLNPQDNNRLIGALFRDPSKEVPVRTVVYRPRLHVCRLGL